MALPTRGDVFVDSRGEGRALRVSWHHEDSVVVLSLWREDTCVGTFRVAAEDVPALVGGAGRRSGQGAHGSARVVLDAPAFFALYAAAVRSRRF